jgi:hypothetical protein
MAPPRFCAYIDLTAVHLMQSARARASFIRKAVPLRGIRVEQSTIDVREFASNLL